jgi:hypothetical protein
MFLHLKRNAATEKLEQFDKVYKKTQRQREGDTGQTENKLSVIMTVRI